MDTPARLAKPEAVGGDVVDHGGACGVGDDVEGNLVTLCSGCHRKTTFASRNPSVLLCKKRSAQLIDFGFEGAGPSKVLQLIR